MQIMSECESDEDVPQLPADTLAALQEFYTDQAARDRQLQEAIQGQDVGKVDLEEDWNLSQFWYSDDTADALTREVLDVAGPSGSVACLSCPTLYKRLREVKPDTCRVVLLEYDQRFNIYGEDFMFYDFNSPLKFDQPLEGKSFDIVVADPPYLSDDCLTKTAITVKLLTKGKIMLCTGEKMEDLASRLLGVEPCTFIPQHTRNLGNEFRCYVNYKTGLS
ncbi:EEF1AKMT1 [Branchiostoma lanceolatum]|uniref:Protein-lysine N-methyltransferase BLAG_LOCUS782 n=1 Tax=Branchiostoma lanceolatum TaxID=7740 RepID=A0A8J9YNU2_BRALA|nr:EEF1AKMT1 [Branchiostoma lanceolatum]